MISLTEEGRCLDSEQLRHLEQSFREWAGNSLRNDVRLARRRILIIFLLIRHTGARLNEILALNPFEDIRFKQQEVCFRDQGPDGNIAERCIHISAALASELREAVMDPDFRRSFENRFDVDPGFVRRKFYERANACGFPKTMGGPEMIRKARAMELMKKNMPLPAIQKMLGHATTYLSQSYESFSEEDIRQVTRLFIEREASSRTSARNSFFGKIQTIRKGSIQAQVTLATISGHSVTTVITNDSLRQLDLKEGRLVKAEIKAPWIILHRGKDAPACSAENRFSGVVEAIITGTVNTEITVRLADGTALCAIVSTESARHMALEAGDPAWAVFNCYAVVLNVDGYDNP